MLVAAATGATAGTAASGRTAATRAAAAVRLDVLWNLLAASHRLGAPLLLHARAGEEVGHCVVPLVAAVLVVAVALFARDRQPRCPRCHVDLWVVDRHAVVERVRVRQREPFDQHALVRQGLAV